MNPPHWPAKFILNTLPPWNNDHRPRLLSADLSGGTQQKLSLTDRWKCESGTGSLGTARRDPGRTDAFQCEMCSHFIQRRPLDSIVGIKQKGISICPQSLSIYGWNDFPISGTRGIIRIFICLFFIEEMPCTLLFLSKPWEYEILMNMKCGFVI